MLTCLSFVFFNLFQFTLIKYLQQTISNRKQEIENRKTSLTDDKALNVYLMQRNRERFQLISKLRNLYKNKNQAFKRNELFKHLALLKLPTKDRINISTNQRLEFLTKKNVKSYKTFLSSRDQLLDNHRSFEYDSNKKNNNNYDRVLKERVDRLVKYNSSSSSSSSDSEEEDGWFQKIKHDYEVNYQIEKIDEISKIIYIAAFLIFNLIYWPFMIIGSNNP